ncbi:hypothetical protein G6F16_005265 [Rhizopus arrhizus]|uniref:Dynein axonemal assembly factor 5 TPR repeats domain-containing protein n=1 Tax=Rhizopus oryzae TaxID=64495 RepID=A0A9P6XED0_RHIOR|nr:hypothetical protein G6F21_003845 [Rhizopus arrhizus]KAG0802522.1 hypothetical protein G6F22_000173 [Rhizopus arrhizus]KAG0814325.1 hypothetical protein G6F20_004868 [Rhizopus arrhizus]KAG0834648.1 hypothetical protein G6F19_005104 [Rhizopus arrhizus]KAG0837339.1 hypothetical protein G6F18_004963 [Rhizopus arrhizus]
MIAVETQEIINTVSPHLLILADKSTKERSAKRRAIEAIKKNVGSIKDSLIANELLDQLADPLLICTESEIETVREQSLQIFKSLVKANSNKAIQKDTLEKLLKTILYRLDVTKEPTEEIRAAWMELCIQLLDLHPTQTDLIMNVIQSAVKDPFPELQKLAGKCIVLFSTSYAQEVDYACDRMVRLVIPLLSHKHIAIRVLGIQSAQSVLMASAKGLPLLFESDEAHQGVVPALIYDTSPLVRQQLFTSLGHLLCQWSPRDRYQYGERILPIILSGVFDELPAVQSTCDSTLTEVADSCVHDLYEAQILESIPEDEKEKKNLGLKHLVHICYDNSLNDLLEKSTDFVASKQTTSLNALKLFLKYATVDDIIKSIKKLLNHLVFVYNSPTNTAQSSVIDILTILSNVLQSMDVFLDVLLPKLDSKYLNAETSGFSINVTISTIICFLNHLLKITQTSAHSNLRIKDALTKIKKYPLDSDTSQRLNKILTSE